MNIAFEFQKLRREIQTHGRHYEFKRNIINEDLEPTGEVETIITSCGLFHISKGYVTEKTTEGTKAHSKGKPMILMLFEDGQNINNGDWLIINNQKFKVVEKNNVQECDLVYDVSLEVVLDGNN